MLAAVGAAAIFLGLAVFGTVGWRQAEQLRQEAEVRRQVALSRQLTAQSVNQIGANNYALALLLAIEAGRAAETAEASSLLHEILTHLGYPLVALVDHTDVIRWVELNRDGSQVLTASSDGTARLWDVSVARQSGSISSAPVMVLSGHTAGVAQAANEEAGTDQ